MEAWAQKDFMPRKKIYIKEFKSLPSLSLALLLQNGLWYPWTTITFWTKFEISKMGNGLSRGECTKNQGNGFLVLFLFICCGCCCCCCFYFCFLSFFFKPELGNWTQIMFSIFEKLTWFHEILTKILQSSWTCLGFTQWTDLQEHLQFIADHHTMTIGSRKREREELAAKELAQGSIGDIRIFVTFRAWSKTLNTDPPNSSPG